MSEPYSFQFSNEFPAGPRGPARSYWHLYGPGQSAMGLICLHHRSEIEPQLTMQSICRSINIAYEQGKTAKAEEIRAALGL